MKFKWNSWAGTIIISFIVLVLLIIFPSNNTQNVSEDLITKIDTIKSNNNFVTKDTEDGYQITNGVKHSVDIQKIINGGPTKDGIPSIDYPTFASIKEANEYLTNDSLGISITIAGETRFYPYKILAWHELVNDNFGSQAILVSYCPLSGAGIVFDRTIDGEVIEFGVSGKLYKSNLVMYNRKGGESLWSQILGQAIAGELTGKKLNVISSIVILYGDWKKFYPDSKVLSKDTGYIRSYEKDPYFDYYRSDEVYFGVKFSDTRLKPKEYIIGIEINGTYKAYDKDSLSVGETKDLVANQNLIIVKDVVGRITISIGDQKVTFIESFWFAWIEIHPDTELFTI